MGRLHVFNDHVHNGFWDLQTPCSEGWWSDCAKLLHCTYASKHTDLDVVDTGETEAPTSSLLPTATHTTQATMADLITDAELDDLLYNSRAGDLDELTQVIGGIEARRRHSPPQGNHAHTDGNTANESDGDVTDVLLYINGKNEDGNTPLHYAAANGHQGGSTMEPCHCSCSSCWGACG